jgi:transient receptor potential cation channel subfamily C member 4
MSAPDVESGDGPDGRKMAYVREFEFEDAPEPILTQTEKMFLLTAEKGDVAGTKRLIDENKGNPKEFNMNCVDPLGRTALLSAIENENFELIEMLLEEGIEVKVRTLSQYNNMIHKVTHKAKLNDF